MFKFIITCLSLLFLSSTVYALEKDKTYILFAIDSDDYIEELNISGEASFTVEKLNTDTLIKFYLLEASAGDYYFSSLKTGIGKARLNDDFSWDFDVVKSKVNYVGHMEVNLEYIGTLHAGYSRVELANKSSFAIEYLKSNHSELFDKKNLVYQGPGKDDFIDFYLANYFKSDEE